MTVTNSSKAILQALLAFSSASWGSAASVGGPAQNPGRETPRIESERFEADSERAKRRAKSLTDSLKIRGKGPFLGSLGMSAGLRGDESGAREAFTKMIENSPSEDEGFQQLADSYFMTGDFGAAAKLYTAALERAPQSEPFYRARRARAYIEMGDARAALRDAEASLALGGAPSEVHLIKARALMRLNDYDGAAKAYAALTTQGLRKPTGEDGVICAELKEHGQSVNACRN